jgi:hypothetical protein
MKSDLCQIVEREAKELNTKLYEEIMKMFYAEKCSKREFACKYGLSHFWFTDFTKIDGKRRELRPRTISVLVTNLGIDPELCYEYNRVVMNKK